jgi:hypothetical protein
MNENSPNAADMDEVGTNTTGRHSVRKALAALTLTGAMLAGGIGVASANDGSTAAPTTVPATAAPATTAPAPTVPATGPNCARVERVWSRLVNIDDRLTDRYQKGVAARDKATAAGKTARASRIDERLDGLRTIHTVVVDRLQSVHERAADRCSLAAVPPTELG